MKLALVTGGFRRLGAAIAARLAADGWTLALHAHAPAEPEPTLAVALGAGPGWHGFAADLEAREAPEALLGEVIAHFGAAPRLIVNNASRFGDDGWRDVSADALERHHRVNVAAPVLLATGLARALAPGQAAAVVNILDQRIRQPHGDQLSYTLSKQALAEATRTLARALAPLVRVNAVAPGLVIPTGDYAPGQLERLAAAMPLGLLPAPAEVADAVAWLAGARAITGQTIFVDGGASLTAFERDFLHLER